MVRRRKGLEGTRKEEAECEGRDRELNGVEGKGRRGKILREIGERSSNNERESWSIVGR